MTNRDFFTLRAKSEHAGLVKVFQFVPAAQLAGPIQSPDQQNGC